MTLTRLAGALRAAGLDITFDELRDIAWLAERIAPAPGGDVNGAGRTDGPARSPVTLSVPAESEAGRAEAAPSLERTVELHAAEDSGHMLYAKVSGQTASSGRARVIRLPGAAALPGALAIGRALRPLSRLRAGKWMVFDERETAERIAESRHPVLVYRPARERWFDVIILTEQVPTLAVWRPVLVEFERLLRRQGFRSVRSLKLVMREGQISAVRPDGMTVSPHALGDREGRRLVLVASDCTSKSWRTGLMGQWIQQVSVHAPVAIVQCLPQSLWPNTAVGFAELHVRSAAPAIPNGRLQVRQPSWAIDEPGVVTPVFSMTPEMVGQWARMVASAGNAWAVAALIPLPGEDGLPDEVAEGHGEMSASERLLRFRASATRDAQELAAYFSVVRPLSPPVMRVIQQAMAPSSDAAALAQVFLGGVLYPDGDVADKEPDDIAYEFHPGLRELLEEALTARQFVKVNLALHDFLEDLSGSPFHFFALLADPNGGEQLPPAAQPFAVNARMFARRFGLGTEAVAPRSRRSVATLRISRQLSRFTFEYDGLQPWSKTSEQLEISRPMLERVSYTGEAELVRKLAAVLIPADVPRGLAQSAAIGWCELEVERRLLHYPWELLLQTGRNGGLLATRFGFTRRFPRQEDRPERAIAPSGAIVVGLEDRYETEGAARLDLTRKVETVATAMAAFGNAVIQIVGADAVSAIDRMLGMPFRFLHIVSRDRAGHLERGVQSESIGEQSGLFVQTLIERGLHAPELVFSERILGPNLVTALFDAGTRVIVEPVGVPSEEDMLRFATAFYQWLSKGASLIQALQEGRLNQAEAQQTSEWFGTFACYGDSDWRIGLGTESDLVPDVGTGTDEGRNTIPGVDTLVSTATPAGEGVGAFERDKAIVAQREIVREAALRSKYALSDDEVLGDVPLMVEPKRVIWLVGLVRHVLVVGHYDGHSSVVDVIPVENLVLVDADRGEQGRASLNFLQNNRRVDYDAQLWPVSFKLQQHVKNLGLLGLVAKANRLQRALQERETTIQAFPMDAAFFEVRRASDDAYTLPVPWNAPSFLDFEADWLVGSHGMVHAFDSSIKADVLLNKTSQYVGHGEKNLLVIPFQVSRPLELVRLTQLHVDEITTVIRTLDIKSEKAVEVIRNGIRAMHRNADGIAWDNPGLGGLLTYSFFADAFSLGHVEYRNPVRLEEIVDESSEDELEESEDTDPAALATWLTEAVDYGNVPGLDTEVFNNLRNAVDRVDWDIEVHSDFSSVETDDVYGVLEDWEFGGIGENGFEAVDYQDDTLTVTRQIVASIRVYASFNFSVKDGIDKDMVYMGSTKAEHVVRANVDAEFEFDGIAKRQPAIKWIDIEHIDRHVDFGYLAPNFGDNELEELDHDNTVRDEDYEQGDLDFGDDDPHDDAP
jgi:hypothetical protein